MARASNIRKPVMTFKPEERKNEEVQAVPYHPLGVHIPPNIPPELVPFNMRNYQERLA